MFLILDISANREFENLEIPEVSPNMKLLKIIQRKKSSI